MNAPLIGSPAPQGTLRYGVGGGLTSPYLYRTKAALFSSMSQSRRQGHGGARSATPARAPRLVTGTHKNMESWTHRRQVSRHRYKGLIT